MNSPAIEDLRVQRSLDFLSPPNSNPVSPRERSDENLIGVGLLFIINANTGKVRVHSIVPDSPAEKCGCINVGDTLVSIDSRPISRSISVTELRSRILGPLFSTITLSFSRNMFEDEGNSPSSEFLRFSVVLSRGSARNAPINHHKEVPSSERTLPSKSFETGAPSSNEADSEFQPRPPPARLLNPSLSINGGFGSISPKQRFSVAGKKPLHDASRGVALEPPPKTTPPEQLSETAPSSLQRIVEMFAQKSDERIAEMFSVQTDQNSSSFTSNDAVSVNAADLADIRRLNIEVQSMDSWLRAKASFFVRFASDYQFTNSCNQEAVVEDLATLSGARQVYDAKKKELEGRIADLTHSAIDANVLQINNAQRLLAEQGIFLMKPAPKIGDVTLPNSGDLANGNVPKPSPAKTLANSASTVRAYSRRPLSESELEFLSYENAGVSSAESRISSAIADSKHQNEIAIVEGADLSVSEFKFSPENHSRFHSRDGVIDSSTSPSKNSKSEHFDGGGTNMSTGPLTNMSSTASASYTYIQSLAAAVHTLEESLNDERKLLLISQHQHHSSVAKIAELERALEHLQAQFLRTESLNQRIMERSQRLESALHAWNFQKMTQDNELHSTHLLVCRTTAVAFFFDVSKPRL